MSKNEIDVLIENYFKWLKDKTVSKTINETWTEITTPYLDRHNDYMQIYAKKDSGSILLTDDGFIINDLELSGCTLDSPRRKEMFQTILNGFGIEFENGNLCVKTSTDSFPEKKHDLIQAMIAVNDLFYLSKPQIQNLFFDDVVTWFDTNDIRYMQDVKFVGKSGFDNRFDFGIPKSKNYSERIVQTVTNPSKENLELLLMNPYGWDTSALQSGGISVKSLATGHSTSTVSISGLHSGEPPIGKLQENKFPLIPLVDMGACNLCDLAQ